MKNVSGADQLWPICPMPNTVRANLPDCSTWSNICSLRPTLASFGPIRPPKPVISSRRLAPCCSTPSLASPSNRPPFRRSSPSQNVAFAFLLPPTIPVCFPLSGGFSWNLGGAFEAPGSSTVRVWNSLHHLVRAQRPPPASLRSRGTGSSLLSDSLAGTEEQKNPPSSRPPTAKQSRRKKRQCTLTIWTSLSQ